MLRSLVGSEMCIRDRLDCLIPESKDRLTGKIHCQGHLRAPVSGAFDSEGHSLKQSGLNVDPHHRWTPILVNCNAAVDLECGDNKWYFTGRSYHDRNSGNIPLQSLGIQQWWWGRTALSEGELIWYELLPTQKSTDYKPLRIAVWCTERELSLIHI